MEYFLDVAFDGINKHGEELCGDTVEVIKTEDSTIIVLADGLGSGVKASILSSLTAKIAGTMMKEGASIYETVDTIAQTLPVCSIRKIAYSTFTIIKVKSDGTVYAAEYDNPALFLVRDNRIVNIEKSKKNINGKIITESNFCLCPGDTLALVSDGAVHAGVGAVLNLGWQWENIADYLVRMSEAEHYAKGISLNLIKTCSSLYAGRPGDDTTAVVVKFCTPNYVDLFTGPPIDRRQDEWIAEKMRLCRGKKVVCGGTAANIIAREWGCDIDVDMIEYDPQVPPTASIEGIDLVTEGVLTLRSTVNTIKDYLSLTCNKSSRDNFRGKDGASKLARMLIYECTHINLWVGSAVNAAHEKLNFPDGLKSKKVLVKELSNLLQLLGKQVTVNYL